MGSKVPLVGGGKASAAVALHAEESRSDPGWLDLLVLTRKDLTCWQASTEPKSLMQEVFILDEVSIDPSPNCHAKDHRSILSSVSG